MAKVIIPIIILSYILYSLICAQHDHEKKLIETIDKNTKVVKANPRVYFQRDSKTDYGFVYTDTNNNQIIISKLTVRGVQMVSIYESKTHFVGIYKLMK